MQRRGIEIGDRSFQLGFGPRVRRDLLRRVEFRRLGFALRWFTASMAVVAVALPVAPAATPAAPPASIVAPLLAWFGRLFSREIAGSPANGIGERFGNRLVGFGVGFARRSAKALVHQPGLLLRIEIAGLRDRNILDVLLRLVVEVIAIATAPTSRIGNMKAPPAVKNLTTG